MSGNSGSLARSRVDIDGVIGALAEEFAAVLLQMSEQVASLHAVIRSGSRITSTPAMSSRGKHSIRFEDQRDRFAQVGASFFESGRLSVGPWKFLDETDIALGNAAKNGVELQFHLGSSSLSYDRLGHVLDSPAA